MKEIDVKNWSRQAAFQNFSTYTNPTFSIGTKLDVTDLIYYCKRKNKSFFVTFLFLLTKCANQIDEMRYRFVKGKVVEFDKVHPSFVVLTDDESIQTCRLDFIEDFEKFYSTCKDEIEKTKQKQSKDAFNGEGGVDYLYVSCLKWLDFTSVSNPYDFKNVDQTSIPRITWGKYVKNAAGRYKMSFDVSVHHALIDGYHVAKLVEKISNAIENIDDFLQGEEENER